METIQLMQVLSAVAALSFVAGGYCLGQFRASRAAGRIRSTRQTQHAVGPQGLEHNIGHLEQQLRHARTEANEAWSRVRAFEELESKRRQQPPVTPPPPDGGGHLQRAFDRLEHERAVSQRELNAAHETIRALRELVELRAE